MDIAARTAIALAGWVLRNSINGDMECRYRGCLCVAGNDGFCGAQYIDGRIWNRSSFCKNIDEAKLAAMAAVDKYFLDREQ